MEATDAVDLAERSPQSKAGAGEGFAAPARKRRRQAQAQGLPRHSVIAHVGRDEPVTKAEIDLVLSFLDASIGLIMRDQ
jgi:hypothetical protein